MAMDYFHFMSRLHDQIREEPAERKLKEIIYQSYRYRADRPELTAFYKRAVQFPPPFLETRMHGEIARMEQRSSALYEAVFREGIQDGSIAARDTKDLLASFYCLLDGISMQMFFYDTETFLRRLDSIWFIFWEGIKRPEPLRGNLF